MAYIGRDTDKISNVEVLDNITFDGSSSYTLQKGGSNFTPSSANTLLLSIDGVVQAGNFTVSGSTIDFGTAVAGTSTCDFILHYGVGLITIPADGSVTAAKLASGVGGVAGITSNADATAITIDSSENVGIGETSPSSLLHLKNATPNLIIQDTGTAGTDAAPTITFKDASSTQGTINFNNGGDMEIIQSKANALKFKTSDTERMRINNDGALFINTTAYLQTTEERFAVNNALSTFSNTASASVIVNRASNDGNLIAFKQNGTQEGGIDVSGTTISYNGFTGTHWSRFQDNSTPTILRGTVLETLDEMCDWYNLEFDIITQDADGNDVTTTKKIPHVLADGQSNGDVITYNHEGTDYQATIVKETDIKHMKSKVSDTTDAKNIYGVFNAYDLDGEGYNDFYVASVGSFVVRIKANETIAKGDLLQSNGDGTAKVQTDDNIKSSSFAKVLSTTVIETYDDGSFIVPCSLMC